MTEEEVRKLEKAYTELKEEAEKITNNTRLFRLTLF
jgi:hypothetical protein